MYTLERHTVEQFIGQNTVPHRTCQKAQVWFAFYPHCTEFIWMDTRACKVNALCEIRIVSKVDVINFFLKNLLHKYFILFIVRN